MSVPPPPEVLTSYLTPDRYTPRGRETRHLAGARRLTLLVERHPVDVILLGEADRRVVLAHGWSGHPSQLGQLAVALVDAGFEVALPSMPGHAHSPPWEPRGTSNFGQFAATIAAAATAVGGVEAVVGHSGGALAGIMALAGVTAQAVAAPRLVALAPLARLRDSVDRHLARTGASRSGAAAFDGAMREYFGIDVFDRTDAVALAPRLPRTGALVVHDEGDDHVPIAEARALAGVWPGAQMVTTTRYGHHLLLRRDDVIAEVVAFLDGPTTGRPAPAPGSARGR